MNEKHGNELCGYREFFGGEATCNILGCWTRPSTREIIGIFKIVLIVLLRSRYQNFQNILYHGTEILMVKQNIN